MSITTSLQAATAAARAPTSAGAQEVTRAEANSIIENLPLVVEGQRGVNELYEAIGAIDDPQVREALTHAARAHHFRPGDVPLVERAENAFPNFNNHLQQLRASGGNFSILVPNANGLRVEIPRTPRDGPSVMTALAEAIRSDNPQQISMPQARRMAVEAMENLAARSDQGLLVFAPELRSR